MNHRKMNRDDLRPLKPLKKVINSATGKTEEAAKVDEPAQVRPECAAEGVEPDMECRPCGEGVQESEAGKRETIRLQTPYKPSQEEVDDHDLTHLPYRSWCRHCIRGRGTETSHFAQEAEDRTVPEVHMDFCFPGFEESKDDYLTVLVARMRGTIEM